MPTTGNIPLLKKYRSFFLTIISLPLIVSILVSLLLPKQYLSISTAIPANSRLTDKNHLISKDLQELYSVFGEANDLDHVYIMARSSTVAASICDSFSLIAHYGLDASKMDARATAIKKLGKNTEILKTETGELKISVWDRSPEIAAAIANAYVDRIESMYRQSTSGMYADIKNKLEKKILLESSASAMQQASVSQESLDALLSKLKSMRELADQVDISMEGMPPALIMIDRAKPSLKSDRPNLLMNALATLAISLFTGSAVLLLFPLARTKP
jgi:hypothetical protein